MAVFIRKQEG